MANRLHESSTDSFPPSPANTKNMPIYYGWIVLIIAALAMIATLPGRSVGLGLITEALLGDLQISRVDYSVMTFWATLIGASFTLICGPLIDRFGVRIILTTVLLSLAAVVYAMSIVSGILIFAILLTLVRGFGQSALSVASLTTVGKWFVKRLSIAMGIFAVMIGVGFVIAIATTQVVLESITWQSVWQSIAIAIGVTGLLSWTVVRRSPESMGLTPDIDAATQAAMDDERNSIGFDIWQALRSPAFWVFTLGSATYNLIIAGVVLFNESILLEYGFDTSVYQQAIVAYLLAGLIANLVGGWLAQRWSIGKLMSMAMILVGAYLALFPTLQTTWHAVMHATLLGASGGVVTVIFFTSYGTLFGRPHLGKIQGVAQIFAVFASATGPWLLATVLESSGSYQPAFYGLLPIVLLMAVAAWLVKLPTPQDAPGNNRPAAT